MTRLGIRASWMFAVVGLAVGWVGTEISGNGDYPALRAAVAVGLAVVAAPFVLLSEAWTGRLSESAAESIAWPYAAAGALAALAAGLPFGDLLPLYAALAVLAVAQMLGLWLRARSRPRVEPWIWPVAAVAGVASCVALLAAGEETEAARAALVVYAFTLASSTTAIGWHRYLTSRRQSS